MQIRGALYYLSMAEVGSFDVDLAKFSFLACVSQHMLFDCTDTFVRGEQGRR